ncbi:ferrochelatase-2, chloroplastic [Trifolium repens]|nr:ferrochelatase-2, chloroplastic [Trifolium repens]
MDGDNAHADASPPHPKLKSAITASSTLFALKNTKGRGFQQDSDFTANRTSRLTGSESKKVMDLRFERSFVSEHIETLEEIDVEYKELALEPGIEKWGRIPALGCEPTFISDLADTMRFSNPHSFSSSQHINRLFSIDSQPSLIPLPVISFDSQPSFSNPPLFVLQHPFFCPSNQILFVSGVSLTIGLKSTMQFFVKRSNFKVIDVCVYPKSSIESGNVCLWSYCCSCLRQFHLLYRQISTWDLKFVMFVVLLM